MLEFMRNNAGGVIGKTIVGAIILTFVLVGGGSLVFDNATGGSPASVNGVDISEYEVQRITDAQVRNFLSQVGDSIDPSTFNDAFIRVGVINNLVDREVQKQSAENAGLAFSDVSVTRYITSAADFQVEGSFDEATYRRVLSQNGYTPKQYKEIVRQSFVSEQLRGGVQNTAFSLDFEADLVSALENQQRDIQYVNIEANLLKDGIEISESEIEEYYTINKDNYQTEEQVKVEYVVLTADSIKSEIEVLDEEIVAAYEEYVAEQESKEVKNISHILVSDEDTANSVLQRLSQGETFEELAQEVSEDPGSKSQGGRLGELTAGVFVSEFENAAFALANEGQISEPVKTQFGYHLIKLDEIVSAEIQTQEEKTEELRAQIVDSKASEELTIVEQELANIAFSSSDLAELASQFQLTVQESDFFTRAGIAAPVLIEDNFINAAFSESVLQDNENSEVIRLADGSLAVLRKADYMAADFEELEAVSEQIKEVLVTEKAKEKAKTLAEDLVEQLNASSDLGIIASQDLEWVEAPGITRSNTELFTSVVSEAFKMPAPGESGFSAVATETIAGDYAIVALTGISESEASEDESQRDYGDYMASLLSQSEFESWFQENKNQANIKIK